MSISKRHRAEYLVATALLTLLRALPLAAASATAGWVARVIGTRLPVNRHAQRNLAKAMPELSGHDRDVVVGEVWDNLGRVVAELAHLNKFHVAERAVAPGQVEFAGLENLESVIGTDRPAVFVSAHLANWELYALAARELKVELHLVYRQANNPLVDDLIQRMRGNSGRQTIPKGSAGAREIVRQLRAGNSVAMLVDQKLNDGIAVPFFGRDAMTATAPAQLALRFDLPIVPVRCERLGGAWFRVTFCPPLEPPSGQSRQDAVRALTSQINAQLEEWIRARPGQWLWLHRRWPD